MRVIAGSAKGARLAGVPAGTRPLSDRAREGLFSSLGGWVVDAAVLDLFAGTGALGIEALSRGAAEAEFVERSRQACTVIRENLRRTGLAGGASVVASEVQRFLARTPRAFDVVLLDPPYATPAPQLWQAIDLLKEGWLAPGATICLTRPRRDYTDVILVNWQVARRLEYGDTLIILYREV